MGFKINIGQLVAGLGLDLTQMQMGLLQAEKSMQQAGKRMRSIGKNMSTSITLPLMAVGGAAFKMGNDFEASMSKIVGLVGVARGQVQAWEKDVIKLASAVGKSPKELGDAMFFITSAGLRGAEAMDVLEMSAKAAASGLGETKVVADLVTSAMNAYGKENLSAAQATDILVAAVREGKAEADVLAAAMGQTLPIASAMGVGFNEVAAAVAAMTRTGTEGQTAAMQLKNILNALQKPASQAEDALNRMGTSSARLRKTIREEGVLAALMEIRSLTKVWGEETMAEVFPNIRALSGVLDLMGSNLKDNVGIFVALEDATGALDKAFEAASKTGQFRFNQVMSDAKIALTELGGSVRDFLIPVFERIRDVLRRATDWFRGLNERQKETVIRVAAVVAAIGPAILIIGKLVSGIGAAVRIFRTLSTLMATNPFMLAATAIIAITTAIISFTKRVSATNEELSKLSSKVKQDVADEKVELELLLRVAEDQNTALEDRKKAIDEINKIMPDYLGNIDEEKIKTGEARDMVDKYIKSLEMKARLSAAEERLVELEKERIRALEEGDKTKVRFLQKAWNAIKTGGNYFQYLQANQETAIRNTGKY